MRSACYDVVVVGGGPAGAGVATWIARGGYHVALLDRARFPRDKPCGEFLTPKTRELFQDLGVWNAACAAGLSTVSATLLCAPNGPQLLHAPLHGGPAGYSLCRYDLDSILLANAREAGVEVREGCAVRGLLYTDGGPVTGVEGSAQDGVPFVLRARLVIGADGSRSLIARKLGLVRAVRRLQRIAVVTHWRDVSGATDTIELRAHEEMVCGMSFPGSRSLPTQSGAGANVTLVASTHEAAQIAGRAGDWVEQTIRTRFPDLADRLKGGVREPSLRTIGCYGHICRLPIADGALLVGDAATFIDPFTGEGVYFSLRGAQLAAETALQALRRAGSVSLPALAPYARARGELTRRYLLCDLVQSVVRTPYLLNRVVERLRRYPGAADLLLGVLGDTRPATAVLHPMLAWRLIGPAI